MKTSDTRPDAEPLPLSGAKRPTRRTPKRKRPCRRETSDPSDAGRAPCRRETSDPLITSAGASESMKIESSIDEISVEPNNQNENAAAAQTQASGRRLRADCGAKARSLAAAALRQRLEHPGEFAVSPEAVAALAAGLMRFADADLLADPTLALVYALDDLNRSGGAKMADVQAVIAYVEKRRASIGNPIAAIRGRIQNHAKYGRDRQYARTDHIADKEHAMSHAAPPRQSEFAAEQAEQLRRLRHATPEAIARGLASLAAITAPGQRARIAKITPGQMLEGYFPELRRELADAIDDNAVIDALTALPEELIDRAFAAHVELGA